jgi:hypothetical protein
MIFASTPEATGLDERPKPHVITVAGQRRNLTGLRSVDDSSTRYSLMRSLPHP